MADRSVTRPTPSAADALARVVLLETVLRDLTRSVDRGASFGVPELEPCLELVDQVRSDIRNLHRRALLGPGRSRRHLSLVRMGVD